MNRTIPKVFTIFAIQIINTMKKLLLLLFFTISITSCDPSPVDVGREAYEAYFKSTLKDPESFKVYSEKYEVESNGMTVHWTIDYGAKTVSAAW